MLTPKEAAVSYVENSYKKINLSIVKLILLGILAGLFIGFAGVGTHFTSMCSDNPGIKKVLAGLIFPSGLAMVVVAGSELFTGNCLLVMPLLSKKIKFKGFFKNLGFVYIGNLIGSLLLSVLMMFAVRNDALLQTTIVSTAIAKVNMGFDTAFVKGILCNVLVCLAVFMSLTAKTTAGKIIGLYFPIMLFVMSGFEHCVANMYYIPAGIFVNSYYGHGYDWLNFICFVLNNLIPVTLGNIVGGMGFGIIIWALYLKDESKVKEHNIEGDKYDY